MKIIFMGTPDFAVPSLDILVKNGYDIVGVITAPDKPAGRGQQLQASAVKEYAVKNKLNILQPTNLKSPEFLNELKSLGADLQIVVAFRMLPELVWNMPPLGTFNLHASLLPQYRGAAPINWAIINGEKETGVTTFFLQHEIDTGKIIFQEKVSISENETAGELHDKLMSVGAALVLKTIKAIDENNIKPVDQGLYINEVQLKHAPKIFKEDCKINWRNNIDSIHNLIRGLSPYPAAWTEFINEDGKEIMFKIYSTLKESGASHTVPKIETDSKNYIKIAVDGGFINILELQQAGKKKMKTVELLRGTSISGKWQIKN